LAFMVGITLVIRIEPHAWGYETSVQCKALTNKGVRCKSWTKDPSGYCLVHRGQGWR